MQKYKEQLGDWAIVTGASSGIGEGFAHKLASIGLNLILIARREDLLANLHDKLENTYKIQVKHLALDLIKDDFISALETLTTNLKVGLVVSNAGNARMGLFHKIPVTDYVDMIRLNVLAQMKIAHWYISKQVENQTKGSLLLVSSTTAFQGVPYAADYSAAKAYILAFGEALNYEYKKKQINVTVLVPGPTNTPGITENKDVDMMSHLPMKPQSVNSLVEEGLTAVIKNKPYHIGGSMNRIMNAMMKLMGRKRASTFWGGMMYKMVKIK